MSFFKNISDVSSIGADFGVSAPKKTSPKPKGKVEEAAFKSKEELLKNKKEIFWAKRNSRDITNFLKSKKEDGNFMVYEKRDGTPMIAYLVGDKVTHEELKFPYKARVGLIKPIEATEENKKQLAEMKETRLSSPKEVAESLENELEDATKYQADEENDERFTKAFKEDDFEPKVWQNLNLKVEEPKTVGGFEVGVAEIRGYRPTMEDAHLATEFTFKIGDNEHKASLFGVFDGHGGPECSKYIAANIKDKLIERLQEQNKDSLTEAGIYNALKMVFVDLTRDYTGPDGSTATTALVIDKDVYVANVGDSRTLIEENGNAQTMSVDAEPAAEKFKKGIEHRGSVVIRGRIFGSLAVGRAVGDKEVPGITARPKITKYTLEPARPGESMHLILACDGVFDVCSSRQVASAAQNLSKSGKNAKEIAETLVKKSVQAGSGDNVSAMVINLSSQQAAPKLGEVSAPKGPVAPLPEVIAKTKEQLKKEIKDHPLHKKGKNTDWARMELAKLPPGTVAIVRSKSDPSKYAAALTQLNGNVEAKYIEMQAGPPATINCPSMTTEGKTFPDVDSMLQDIRKVGGFEGEIPSFRAAKVMGATQAKVEEAKALPKTVTGLEAA